MNSDNEFIKIHANFSFEVSSSTYFIKLKKSFNETFVRIINQVIIKMNEKINQGRMRIHRL